MVAERTGRKTLTPAEAAVIRLLRPDQGCPPEGIATGPNTREVQRRLNLGRGPLETFHQVDLATARRLQKAGLVHIDAGGMAHLTDAGHQAVATDPS